MLLCSRVYKFMLVSRLEKIQWRFIFFWFILNHQILEITKLLCCLKHRAYRHRPKRSSPILESIWAFVPFIPGMDKGLGYHTAAGRWVVTDWERCWDSTGTELMQRWPAVSATDVEGQWGEVARLCRPRPPLSTMLWLKNYLRISPSSQLDSEFSNLGTGTEMPSKLLYVNVGINK